jgi:hypothetical protein
LALHGAAEIAKLGFDGVIDALACVMQERANLPLDHLASRRLIAQETSHASSGQANRYRRATRADGYRTPPRRASPQQQRRTDPDRNAKQRRSQ